MARAAVKAKQQAKSQAAKPSRARGRRRGHSGGGDPNQQLFFMRLRRRQKWVYAALAVIFAATFVGVGVGSGTGGLNQLWTGLFGGGSGGDVAKAQDEIKSNPTKGYLDLARAYETKGQTALAIDALTNYVKLKNKDANAWAELGGLQLTQAQTYATKYQQAQQAAQLADPSVPFQPTGTLAQAAGSNPAYSTAAQEASSRTSQYYQQATTLLSQAVSSYQTAKNIHPRSANAWQQLASAAENAGNYKLAITSWKRYLKLDPTSPQRNLIKQRIKQLQKALAPATASTSSGSSASSGSGG